MDAPTMLLMNGQSKSKNYYGLLKKSIHYFLREYPKNIFRLSDLASEFDEVIRNSEDSPIEIIWFYGAVRFHACNPTILLPQAKLMLAKELLEFLSKCVCPNSVVRKVVVIAPVLYLVYHLYFEFSARDPSLRQEIGIFVEEIVSRIIFYCAQYFYEGDRMTNCLRAYILHLVRVWTVDPIRINNKIDDLASFFPPLDNEFQEEAIVSMGYLVGVVMNEALLLRLCLKISPGVDKEVLRRDMLNSAIQTIKGFQKFYFLGD